MRTVLQFFLSAFVLWVFAGPLPAQWVQMSGPLGNGVHALMKSGVNLYAGTGDQGVFVTPDVGANWNPINTGLGDSTVYDLLSSGADLFAATYHGGVFRSTNGGGSWHAVNGGLTNLGVLALAARDSILLAGTGRDIFRSVNNGELWTPAPTGYFRTISSFASSGALFFAGAYGGIFLSTDMGETWSPASSGLKYSDVRAMAASGTHLFAGTKGGGVFTSIDSGQTWSASVEGLGSLFVYALLAYNDILFAGTANGVYVSPDYGAHWMETGFAMIPVFSLAASDSVIFAGTTDGYVWRRPVSELITPVEARPADVPTRFSLAQNYPNPFNPSTVISYRIPVNSWVTLKVFDVLGREIATLVDAKKTPGAYVIHFDGSKLGNGVYFCRLCATSSSMSGETGNVTQSRKMLLIK